MTLLRNSFVNVSACVECMTISVVWAQCDVRAWDRDSGNFCSLECLRVWAIKRRLVREST